MLVVLEALVALGPLATNAYVRAIVGVGGLAAIKPGGVAQLKVTTWDRDWETRRACRRTLERPDWAASRRAVEVGLYAFSVALGALAAGRAVFIASRAMSGVIAVLTVTAAAVAASGCQFVAV